MDKLREALERGLDKARHKKRADAMEPIMVNRWFRMWAFDLETNSREALAELEKLAASDARELASLIWDIVHMAGGPFTEEEGLRQIAKAIESFSAARERKASEETARKCAEAADEAVGWNLPQSDRDGMKAAIMEAAK